MGSSEVILLDTHVWVWWVQNDARIGDCTRELDLAPAAKIAVSAVSCWEVAVLHARGRLVFDCSLKVWMEAALEEALVRVVDLTPAIAIESEQLPGEFHCDPADRMLVATARLLDCYFLTEDRRILAYSHVRAIDLRIFRGAALVSDLVCARIPRFTTSPTSPTAASHRRGWISGRTNSSRPARASAKGRLLTRAALNET